MNGQDIIERKLEILEDIARTRKLLECHELQLSNLQIKCDHNIVFMLPVNQIHKVGPMQACFCPACGKTIKVFTRRPISKTDFKNSKVVDLTDIEMNGLKSTLEDIQFAVSINAEYYYGDISSEELAQRMKQDLGKRTTKKNYCHNNSFIFLKLFFANFFHYI